MSDNVVEAPGTADVNNDANNDLPAGSPSKVKVRVLGPGDESHVVAAVKFLGHTSPENAAAVFLKDPSVVAVGAFADDAIVGFAYGYVQSRPDAEPMANLYALDVWPDHQRMGLGSKLIKKFRAELGRVSKVWLVVPEDNEVADRFYESLGATETDTENVFELSGDDAAG